MKNQSAKPKPLAVRLTELEETMVALVGYLANKDSEIHSHRTLAPSPLVSDYRFDLIEYHGDNVWPQEEEAIRELSHLETDEYSVDNPEDI